MTATYIVGDVGDVLATIPDDSIDLVMTSPPFLALRSYLPADHPDKDREIGSEPDPATFLDTLLALSAEWRRVLAPHGSLCVELGDTYSGARGYGNPDSQNPAYGERSTERWEEARVERRFKKEDDGWPLAKSACLIPELYRVALAYGRNPLTGAVSPAGSWRVRNTVRWCRPNPPVGALGDKFRPATSDMVVACVSPRRYFDLDAVRTPPKSGEAGAILAPRLKHGCRGITDGSVDQPHLVSHPAGAPPLDYWVIPTFAYSGSHYAAFAPALVEKPIQSMVPQRVCRTCGEPSRRITAPSEVYAEKLGGRIAARSGKAKASGLRGSTQPPGDHITADRTTVGWTDCGHDSWRTGVVLDPFAGSGTTLMVASGHGRDSIGIDIDERNADLALERVGPLLLTVEHLADRVTP